MENFFEPLATFSPTLQHLNLVLVGPAVSLAFRSGPWPNLSKLHLHWTSHDVDASDIAHFLNNHPELRYVRLRGNTAGVLRLAESTVLDLHTLDTNTVLARDLLRHPGCFVRHLEIVLDAELDSISDIWESGQRDSLVALGFLWSHWNTTISQQTLRAIGVFAPHLQVLIFRGHLSLDTYWSAFCDILTTMQHLRTIGLPSYCSSGTNFSLESLVGELVARLPLLKKLDLATDVRSGDSVTEMQMGEVLVRATQDHRRVASFAIQHPQLDATSRLHL